MTRSSDTELDALCAEFDMAMAAEIPNLVEIRRCKNRILKSLARCVLEIMQESEQHRPPWHGFDVIRNDHPVPVAPRGICSPIKTEGIRQFERRVRKLFGAVGPCTTSWEDG
jgi:hypothetical protein